MNKVESIITIASNPLESITSAMEGVVELKMKSKVTHLMLISIALANFAANKECNKPEEAYYIKDAIDEIIINALMESLEVE